MPLFHWPSDAAQVATLLQKNDVFILVSCGRCYCFLLFVTSITKRVLLLLFFKDPKRSFTSGTSLMLRFPRQLQVYNHNFVILFVAHAHAHRAPL